MRAGKLSIMLVLLIAAASPAVPANLGTSLAQIMRFAANEGENLWPGYGSADFGFLLIEADVETLLCRDHTPEGFVAAGRDPFTDCVRFTRPRSGLPDNWLAAMPLFGPPWTIVMGTPESTGRSEPDWIRTILHEHFHQWQSGFADYYARLDALDLKDGDETGMWALNFSFPYDEPDAVRLHASASVALADAVEARGTPEFASAFDRFLAARLAIAAAVGPRNWRYVEFQLWQEGVARWTEIALGQQYPDETVRASAYRLETQTIAALRTPDLTRQRREFVYVFGAGEAMLLEACGPAWRDGYPTAIALGPLLDAARPRCNPS